MRLEALPVRIEGDHVMVAVAEPTEEKLAELRRLIGEDTVVVVVPKTALDGGIDLLATQPEGAPPPPPPPPKAPPEPAPAPAPPAPPAGPAAAATNGSQSPGALDLAAQARNFADSIAAQAAAMQEAEQRIAAQAAAMEESEQRIAALEGEVAAGRAAMQEAKTQLAAVLRLFESA
jgi:hypothetical protein